MEQFSAERANVIGNAEQMALWRGGMHSGATASQTLAYLGLNYSPNYPMIKSQLLSSFNAPSEKLLCRMRLRTHASIGSCEWLHAERCCGSTSKVEPHCDPKEHPNAPLLLSFSSQGLHGPAEALLMNMAHLGLSGSFVCIKVAEIRFPRQLRHLPKDILMVCVLDQGPEHSSQPPSYQDAQPQLPHAFP